MKKNMINKILKISIVSLFLCSTVIVFAEPPAPPGGGMDASSVTHSSVTSLTEGTHEEQSFSSVVGGQNALLVKSGTVTLKNPTITKTGDESSENSDFYGTNAGIFVYDSGTLNMTGGTVTTNGSHANGVFAYDSGTINITNTTIKTTSNNSGGIMVTGGGKLNATNLNVETSGNSSAAIRSDRGGGDLTVKKGTYKTTGVGSPSIYSTAKINVSDATLESTASEGIVVEGANSVTIENVKLTDTNNTLNGNSETYKDIFLYQSMSGDANEGNASFSSKDSTIKTNKGDTIFVTNTTATISLENNKITNKDGDFLRIQTGKWGNSGANGGNVTINLINQKVDGNIIVDKISSLVMNLTNKSVYQGEINTENTGSSISIKLEKDSVLVLNGDSYISSLENGDSSNNNIYLNGHKLIVSGKEVSGNTNTYAETKDNNKDSKNTTSNNSFIRNLDKIKIISIVIGGILVLTGIISLIVFLKNKKNNRMY